MDLTICLLFVGITSTYAQVPFSGNCPNVTVKQNFVPANYFGDWYEQKKYFAIFQAGGTCASSRYTDKGNGEIGVLNRHYNPLLERYSSFIGTGTLTSNTGEAKIRVRFPLAGGFQGYYWVLGTDYTSFSVVWSCTDLSLFNFQFAWVLTRERFPRPHALAAAEAIILQNGLPLSPFIDTNQNNCP